MWTLGWKNCQGKRKRYAVLWGEAIAARSYEHETNDYLALTEKERDAEACFLGGQMCGTEQLVFHAMVIKANKTNKT